MCEAKRKVLILSYYYPPLPSAGSVRMAGLARYLRRFGWAPTVVTPRRPRREASTARVVDTDDADLAVTLKRWLRMRPDAALKDLVAGDGSAPESGRRLQARMIDAAKALLAFPDTNRGWIRIAATTASELVVQERFDALLTTSPPPSVHLAGCRVARRGGPPWVADLRDLWSDDRFSTAPRWRRFLDRKLEIRTLRRAYALVTVSAPFADELKALHPGRPVHTIRNGFDPEWVDPSTELTSTFTITHTGTLHQGRRDPSLLFAAVANLIRKDLIARDRLRIRLFVRHEPWVASLASSCGLDDLVELLPWSDAERVRHAQRESQILLLLHWGGPRESGVYTGKVFEYLAARRPILVAGGDPGVLTDLMHETGAGVHVSDLERLEAQLLDWWREYQAEGSVQWLGDDDRIGRYSHLRMAEEYARVLDGVVEVARG